MPINVRLLDHTSDPTRSLYVAYRTAYSTLTPQTIVDRIESERITREQMLDFIEKRLETGHASPAGAGVVWVRDLERQPGVQPSVRAPSHRYQLRAGEPA